MNFKNTGAYLWKLTRTLATFGVGVGLANKESKEIF